jgi:hypothetical protein
VLASKVGADSSLVVSPVKVNDGCCEPAPDVTEDEVDEVDEVDAPEEEALNNIQGTATCFPYPNELEEEIPVELEVDEELDELLGEVLLELEPAFPDNEMTANSRRPEAGLTIASLMVPI